MMGEADIRRDNDAFAGASPLISVLTPFLGDDPRGLLAGLEREASKVAGLVEVIAFDDGGQDDALADAVSDFVGRMMLPASFIRSRTNLGRARARNRLAAESRGRWLLFMDSDMLPDAADFLCAYLKLIRTEAPEVAFGGLSLDQTPPTRPTALHRSMALKTDCLPAEARAAQPEKNVFTSNLLVRREVFDQERFDETFAGWGWEDVEWAMRVSRGFPIRHVENTATHLGLDPASVMAGKYEQSAANFARIVRDHRELVETYPSYRVARVLKRAPLRGAWRPWLKQIALAEAVPLGARAFAMRLYRAALYAEAV
jgi:glycosyltransferase involved in cell wall biosynthesis